MIYFAAYLLMLALFLIANKRWADRMAAYDAGTEQGVKTPRSRVYRDS